MNRIKELRISNNLTQKEIAKYLHITRSAYAQYESGLHQPALDIMLQLSDYYHVNLEYLCGRTEYSNPINQLPAREPTLFETINTLSELDRQTLSYLIYRLQLSPEQHIAESNLPYHGTPSAPQERY
ncbi:MAG: helix-turn-helix domain-containing protein [Lachnospiraceae bacterium]